MYTHDDAVLPNLNMTADCRCLDDATRADMHMIANFHWIIVE